ncbi:hypothetical protein ACT1U9_16245 [Streptomyces sp. BR1]|uniref:hypothetical protein n=1 Tax=Streptomyces sp. BR1 TaxID=1592323 RepID=UPI00402BBD59
MTTALTIAVMLILIAGAAWMIHLLNAQHADRIALHHYSRYQFSRFQPGRRPLPGESDPPAVPARRDHQDGGRGRLRPRRRIRQGQGR